MAPRFWKGAAGQTAMPLTRKRRGRARYGIQSPTTEWGGDDFSNFTHWASKIQQALVTYPGAHRPQWLSQNSESNWYYSKDHASSLKGWAESSFKSWKRHRSSIIGVQQTDGMWQMKCRVTQRSLCPGRFHTISETGNRRKYTKQKSPWSQFIYQLCTPGCLEHCLDHSR